MGASESSRQRREGLCRHEASSDASSSFAPADREKCREDAAALADVLATDDLPLVRMDAALLLAAPIQAGDGVVQRLAGDDDPDVSEAGFNALKAREERVRDDSSCAVDFGRKVPSRWIWPKPNRSSRRTWRLVVEGVPAAAGRFGGLGQLQFGFFVTRVRSSRSKAG